MSSREFLPSEVARLVLSYLLENNYDGTKEIFMSECPALAELKSLTPHTLIHNSTVNGRTLSKILKDYMSLIEKLKELAVDVSSGEETDDVQYLPPLKVLSFLARRLSFSTSSREKFAPVTANKTSQTEQEVRCEDFSCQTDLSDPSQQKPSLSSTENLTPEETSETETAASSSCNEGQVKSPKLKENSPRANFFHPNIRVPPPPEPGLVPILPKPKFESKSRSDSAPVSRERNKEADTPLNDNNFQERLSRDEIIHSTPSLLRDRERKSQPRKSKHPEDDFLDDLLGNLGNKIASIIPENVSSQNILDIVEEGINNEDIIADLMSMFGDSAASVDTQDTSGDSRVNTPVSSPLPDLMGVEPPPSSDPVETVEILPLEDGNESEGFDASLSVTHVESNVMDMLGKVVNETINVVTEPFVKQINPDTPATSDQSQTTNKRKRKKQKTVLTPSKKPKNQEGVEDIHLLSNFRRQFGDVVSSAKVGNYPGTEKETNVEETVVENNIIAAITSMVKGSNKEETKEKEESREQIIMEDINIIADPADFDENIVVEVLEEGLKVEEKSKRRERCNKCPGCLAPPCGQCPECKDKKANGGPGVLKKACRQKPCDNLRSRKTRPYSQLGQNIENIKLEGKSQSVHRGLSKQQPFHVRNLVFSPPRGKQNSLPRRQKALIKTLSPEKSASPQKNTDPAWNESCNTIFQQTDSVQFKPGPPSEKSPADETKCETQTNLNFNGKLVDSNPYLLKKDLNDLNKPLFVPISANMIPSSAVVQTLPPGFKSLGYSAILSQPSITSINKLNVERNSSSSVEKNEETDGQNNKIFVTEHNQEPGSEAEVKTITIESRRTPKNSFKFAGNKKSIQKPVTWDEKLRAVLGSAEKDVSHISHKLSEKEKKVKKRSPTKIIYEENSESGDEENPVELALTDKDITPAAQKILDTFANQLLWKLEEGVQHNVLQLASNNSAKSVEAKGGSALQAKTGADVRKDCICCKMEGVIKGKRRSHEIPLSLSGLEDLLGSVDRDVLKNAEEGKRTEPSLETPERKDKSETEKSEMFPKHIFKTPSKADFLVFKTPVKTISGSLTTPIKSFGGVSPMRPSRKSVTPRKGSERSLVLSPPSSHLSVPLTPSRCSDSRSRHKSSIQTPVCTPQQSELETPTTPRNKNSPAPSYYTPSPSPRSQYSVPSPSYTPGLKFLQEEGDRLSQSDDSCSSPSPLKAGAAVGAQKRKSFRNLFKKATTESAGKELGSLLEQKISSYPFTGQNSPGCSRAVEPFMSPAGVGGCDYTSSPQISLKPSPSQEQNISRHSSFVSPNRTCYLSPTGVALTSSVLGFHQSPHNTTGSEETDMILQLDSDEDNGVQVRQSQAAKQVAVEAAGDSAVDDSTVKMKAELTHQASVFNLSDDSNTLSNHTAFAVTKQLENKKVVQPSLENISNIELSEDDSDDEKEEENPTQARTVGKSERKTQTSTTSKPEGKNLSTWTPRKPRRVPLISTKRTSPLKNDSTWFEARHDANNLDKNRSNNSSMIWDQTLGEKASIDLGLETNISEVENGVENLRKSPRKQKRKDSICPDSPRAKKAKMPEKAEFTDKKELTLFFSPKKRTSEEDPSSDTAIEEERPITPTICKALGLQRNESSKEEGDISDGTASRFKESACNTDSQTKSQHRTSTDCKERKESDSSRGKDPERKASKSSESRTYRKDKSTKHSSEEISHESSSRSSRSRSNSKNVKPKILTSSPRKTEGKVPNILCKSSSKDVKIGKIKPPTKQQEFKGKKGKDERRITVAQKSPKESVSDVLNVPDPRQGLVEGGNTEIKTNNSAPVFEQLLADSEKILATLKMTQTTTANEKPVSKGKNSKEPRNASKFGLTRSSFFVFNNKLPFGCFEEDN